MALRVPHFALSCALLGGVCSTACGDAPQGAAQAREGTAADDKPGERLLTGDPKVALELLGGSHAATRHKLGAHTLVAQTSLSLRPTREMPANPPVDSASPVAQSVNDTLALRWDEPGPTGPRFALEQHNDHDRGRSVVVLDGQLYAKLEHRTWTMHPLESEIHERWLDDAWRIAHDTVEFLLPGAMVSVDVAPGTGWQGADAIVLTLAPGSATSSPPQQNDWRADVAFSALSGRIVIDAETGAWLAVDATARYTLSGGAGGPLEGEFEVHGKVAPNLPGAPSVEAPTGAVALPQRHRYEEERKRLLDGLAAP